MLSGSRPFAQGRSPSVLLTIFILFSLLQSTTPAQSVTLPELPRVYLETTYVPPTGTTIAVPAGGDFQAALNAAQPGDVITLEAGATFRGPFSLPVKAGTGWIVVRTSAPDSSLPAPGTRIDPSYASVLPKLVAASGSVLTTVPGAHHYRFLGVEIAPTAGTYLYNLVLLGSGETSLEALPHDFIFDRSYLHGDPAKGTRRGIALNAARVAVIDSYLADFKEVGADSQALAGWNGPGPFKLVNNHLEGAGENLLFGGADPSIPNLVPSDIEIRHNHVLKPLSWKADDPSYAGTHWSVKNLLELKNAQRVLIEGNLFEQNWGDAQVGFAILFTVRNQSGTAPWSIVADVTFQRNLVRHTGSGVNILGYDTTYPSGSQQTARILLRNNLFADVNGPAWGADGRLFQVLSGTADVAIDHNTGFQTGTIMMADGTPTNTGFAYTNNLAPHGSYGFFGSNVGEGTAALQTYFPGAVFDRNIVAGGDARSYPPDNFFPASLEAVGFVNLAGGDYHLAPSSPYKGAATDGTDVGADIDALTQATAGVVQDSTASGASGGDPGGGSCFIATAAYGSPLAPQVALLRAFRDRYLMATSAGAAFVRWYYRVSPPLAAKIRQSYPLKILVRAILWPLVGTAWVILHPSVVLGLAMIPACLIGLKWRRQRMKR